MGGPALINNQYYDEFDNFFICSFEEDNIIYKSTEHYYQSKKVLDPKIQKLICNANSVREAYSLGQMYPLRKGWDDMKVKIMLQANKLKFDQNLTLKKMLVETEGEIEFPYSDNFWGSGPSNMLGKILMILRAYYKKDNRSFFTLQEYFNFHIDWH
jgi:ribA/ribD-fused uncharacterized protein